MSADVSFWSPQSSSLRKEEIYGEKWLRFSYETLPGKLGLWAMVKRAWFSRWYGRKMDMPDSKKKIYPFIEKYGLDTSEFKDSVDSFNTFNQFFFRHLKPESRPVIPDEQALIFPADGRHLLIPDLSKTSHIYAKGQKMNLEHLLGCQTLANYFKSGSLLISRLCPVDYHRFHFPVSGKITENRLINGDLFSVNPIALRRKISIFWQNKRYLNILENDHIGKIVQILIGATCVGTVHFTAQENSLVRKGEEFGYFSFGGSCVITIFPENSVSFNEELLKYSAQGYECYFKMGQYLGSY